jgi:hypothetical protein
VLEPDSRFVRSHSARGGLAAPLGRLRDGRLVTLSSALNSKGGDKKPRSAATLFLRGMPDEEHRTPGTRTGRECLRDSQQRGRARTVSVGAVVDPISAYGGVDAEVVEWALTSV